MEDKMGKRVKDIGKIIIGELDCKIPPRREENEAKKRPVNLGGNGWFSDRILHEIGNSNALFIVSE